MSKAEKYIRENTRNCSNDFGGGTHDDEYISTYYNWLTPEQARKAVEIAREEVIEKTLDFLKDRLYKNGYVGIIDLCDDYTKAMKDETQNL